MKIAFIIQRYGLDINGGAEHQCRAIAERLADHFDVEVLTTTAQNYQTWEGDNNKKFEVLNNIKIRRFPVDFPRIPTFFNQIYDLLVSIYKYRAQGQKNFERFFNGLDLFQLSQQIRNPQNTKNFSDEDMNELQNSLELLWIKQQGPFSTSLFNFIEENIAAYDCFLFFSYTYAHCYYSLPSVADKTILIPTAHNDPCLGFQIFDRIFKNCKYYICQTLEEKELIQNRIQHYSYKQAEVISLGIEVPKNFKEESIEAFHKVPYMLYIGRLEEGKGTLQLIEMFLKYRSTHPDSTLELLLAGESHITPPIHPQIRYLGVISEHLKWKLIRNCLFLVNPSRYESLSIVLLEAWLMKKPTLVNKFCEATSGQTARSQGGLVYKDQKSFDNCLSILSDEKNSAGEELGKNGNLFVKKHYTWKEIIGKYRKIIAEVASQCSENK